MLPYPKIDPVALAIGPLRLHWYGITYIVGFVAGWLLGRYRAARPGSGWRAEEVDDLATCAMVGVILGARLGYVLFYDVTFYLADPWEILRVWNGGMSFHGGLAGVLTTVFLWKRTHNRRFLDVTDFLAPLVPLGIFCGRIGNFINAELWGKPTTMEWGMIFPGAGTLPRHPTQLYEAGLEGIMLFTILWLYSRKPRLTGTISGLFAVLYSLIRISMEFFRMPDPQLGYIYFGWVTMGQILCLPLLLAGLIIFFNIRLEKAAPSRDRVVLDNGSVIWVKRR